MWILLGLLVMAVWGAWVWNSIDDFIDSIAAGVGHVIEAGRFIVNGAKKLFGVGK